MSQSISAATEQQSANSKHGFQGHRERERADAAGGLGGGADVGGDRRVVGTIAEAGGPGGAVQLGKDTGDIGTQTREVATTGHNRWATAACIGVRR